MTSDLIHDRGRGPEIKGTRITVYNLMSYLLDPTMTETLICAAYDHAVTPEQVAAARAYVLNNADTVLAEHLKIEERIANEINAQNRGRAIREKGTFLKFKEWLVHQEEAAARERAEDAKPNGNQGDSNRSPTFREWLLEQESRSGMRS